MKGQYHPIHKSAVIFDNVVLGKDVFIGANAVIGAPAEVKGHQQISRGKVIIRDNTIIRECVTVHSPRADEGCTVIGDNCYIQAHSHIGHDAKIGDNVTIACHALVGGHVVLEDHVNLALHAVTHPRTIIRKGTLLGCNSFAKGELKAWSIYVGTPAKWKKWNNHLREKLGLEPLE